MAQLESWGLGLIIMFLIGRLRAPVLACYVKKGKRSGLLVFTITTPQPCRFLASAAGSLNPIV